MQTRFHNYHRPLVSYDENSRIMGAIPPGVHCGFDSIELKTGTTIAFKHDFMGVRKTQINGLQTPYQSLVVSRSGVFIYEDAPIELNVAFNPTAYVRVDLLVMTHSFIDVEGGSNASYSIIQGPTGPGVPIEPTVSDPKIQVPIGYLYIAAGAVNHSQTAYRRVHAFAVGGRKALTYDDENNASLYSNPPQAYFNDFNKLTKNGIYFTNAAANRPVSAISLWFIIINRRQSYATQMAFDATTGKAYVRSTPNLIDWTTWTSLNNSDLSLDFTNILNAIGNREYTNQFFILNGESITESLDKVDIELQTLVNAINAIINDFNTLDGIIGARLYTQQITVTNEETITSSLDQLDLRRRVCYNDEDLNDYPYNQRPGTYTINPFNQSVAGFAHPANTPNYVSKQDTLILTVSGRQRTSTGTYFTEQRIENVITGSIWRRLITGTTTFSAWSCIRPAISHREIGDWNIPAGNRQFNHGLPAGKIMNVKASVRNDASTIWVDICGNDQATSTQYGGVEWNDTQVILKARLSGPLDNTNYDSTSFNRGYVEITYLDATPT